MHKAVENRSVPRVLAGLGLALSLLAGCAEPDPGLLSVENPDALVAGAPGELRLRYRTGENGFHEGDSLWLELPAAWYNRHGCPNVGSLALYQSENPGEANYFGVEGDPGDGLGVVCFTFPFRRLDGLGSRFKSILVVAPRQGGLPAGEDLTIVVRGQKENGSFVVPEAAASGWIRALFVPRLFSGSAVPLPSVHLSVQPGAPEEIFLALPSLAQVGETVTLRMRLLDRYYNPCPGWPAPVRFEVPGAFEGFPGLLSERDLEGFPDGWVRLDFRVLEPGDYTVRAVLDGLGLAAESNPLRVLDHPVSTRVFWGDLHAHSEVSKDGMGEMPFEYAREASQLDFFALTEHHSLEDVFYPEQILFPALQWEQIQEEVRSSYRSGEFVTLLGFENSASSPSGHHNVYYPGDAGPLLLVDQMDETWTAVEPHGAIMIQHHPGIFWVIPGIPPEILQLLSLLGGDWVDWTAWPEIPRPALEIYSLHGQSEFWDPGDPLSHEACDLTLPRDGVKRNCQTGISTPGPHYARDAWASGLRLGTVAGSDDHRAQPGKPGGGLTAVQAESLTRDSVFRAIRDRRTYATTGDRILLDFRIDGAPMGSEIQTTGLPRIEVDILGTAEIRSVEVLRYRPGPGPWEVAASLAPGSRSAHLFLEDASFSGDAVYYVRLEQSNLTNGRPVRAWSSPIWVTRGSP